MSEEKDENALVPVYVARNPVEAEIVRNALIEEGIRCEAENENQAGFAGLLDIRLFVREADVGRAEAMLAAHQHNLTPLKEGEEIEGNEEVAPGEEDEA